MNTDKLSGVNKITSTAEPLSAQAQEPDQISTTLKSRLLRTMAGMLVAKAIQRHPLSQSDIEELRAAGAAEVQAILAAMHRELADAESIVNDLAVLNEKDLSGRLRRAIDRYHYPEIRP